MRNRGARERGEVKFSDLTGRIVLFDTYVLLDVDLRCGVAWIVGTPARHA